MGKLNGKVALVTGAGRGIGLAVAQRLAAEGARLLINDLDEEPARQAAQTLAAAGADVQICAGSITDPDFPQRFIDDALRHFGGIDILVNNAGYIWNSRIAKITDAQWDAMQDVHLKAPFRLLRALYPVLKNQVARETEAGERRPRKIVNVASLAASRGIAGQAAYSAAKAGLFGLTRTLAREWGPLNVNVNCVAFGLIETRLTQEIRGETAVTIGERTHRVGLPKAALDDLCKQIPLGRAGTPEEAAGGIMLMCLPESNYVSGQIIEVDGGMG